MSILQGKKFLFAALVGVILTLASPAQAIPVEGQLAIGGSSAEVGATFLNFVCSPNVTASCPANYGNFLVTSPSTGAFAPYLNEEGFIHNLSQASQPINQAFNLSNFVLFDAVGSVITPDIALDLTFIFPGVSGQTGCVAAPTPGQTCTPALGALITASNLLGLSPFNLQNTQTGSSASFSIAGNARRISTGEISAFTGLFTAQFNVPYQNYLATIASGGSITNSYSATFLATVTPVPEPSSITMILGGLLVAGSILRRRM